MKYGKVWGETIPLIQTPLVEVHKVKIEPETKCSLHTHNYKWNAFYVVSGKLNINVQKNNYDLTDVTVLGPGDFTTVKPGEYHWFENPYKEPVEALEIYYLEPLSEDIVRKTSGGVLKKTDDKDS